MWVNKNATPNFLRVDRTLLFVCVCMCVCGCVCVCTNSYGCRNIHMYVGAHMQLSTNVYVMRACWFFSFVICQQRYMGYVHVSFVWRRVYSKATPEMWRELITTYCTNCNNLKHTATHGNTLQHIETHGNSQQLTASHWNTLQNNATCHRQGPI